MQARLGVNIDHVATIRQARGEAYPLLTRAAIDSIDAGADQITIHLREDRRHIQDQDVFDIREITKNRGVPLNLEMAASEEILSIAIKNSPDWICLVPEKREERTTEGGLNLKDRTNYLKVKNICEKIKNRNSKIKISLFLEADLVSLNFAKELNADAVEIHTGTYAKNFLEKKSLEPFLLEYKKAQEFLIQNSISCHAGHGLTLDSVRPLVKSKLFSEYNIGHWIISEALFKGLPSVISELKKVITCE